jgi:hypothetical protein
LTQPGLEIGRQGGFYGYRLASRWLVKYDAVGVEEIAGESGFAADFGGGAVETVAYHGLADAGEMYADLVCAAGADAYLKQREAIEPPQHVIFAPGGAALGQAGSHAHALAGIAGYRLFDAAAILLHFAVNQGEISLLHLAIGELFGEALMRGIVLGYQEHAAGVAVEAMNNAGPQFAGVAGESAEAMQERIDQRAGMDACAGMHDHAGGLIDGHDVRIFVEDGEGDLLRCGMERGRIGRLDVNDIRRPDGIRRTGGVSVDEHMAALDPTLHTGAADLGKALVHRVIQPFARILLIQLDSQAASSIHIVANGCNLFREGQFTGMQATMRQRS